MTDRIKDLPSAIEALKKLRKGRPVVLATAARR